MEANDFADLALLDSQTLANEGAVIQLIRNRYAQDKIYTAISDILLSVNPFKCLPIYGPEWIQANYRTSGINGKLPPHVYSKAKDILRSLYHSSESQCCVVTGYSGAGKTEAVKHILQYIANVSVPTDAGLTSKFLQVHCILEAFGNATTLQNKNSSRFAAYLEILYTRDHKLCGGQVCHYMLEKSRVVHQKKGGKNFHIFHYLLSGMSADQLQEYSLAADYPHRYLSYDPMVPPEDDTSKAIQNEKFAKLLGCMESLGFTTEDKANIFKVLAAVLHIGNVAFGAVSSQTNAAAFIHDQQPVHCASSHLGVTEDALGTALVLGMAFQRGEKVSVPKTAGMAAEGRENLAKMLYSHLLSWIMFKVNTCLMENDIRFRYPAGPSIGLLDVFGFETFDINGLEQLCVNMANEQLAHFYNEHVFAWEQAELESEGLRCSKTPFYDNKKALELLLSPPQGLFPLLDEESQDAKASDAAFVKKCDTFHKKNPHYKSAKLSYPAFHVQHYTGYVNYVALGFLDTNRDILGTSLLHCMRGSSDEFISGLFKAGMSGTGSLILSQPKSPKMPVTSGSIPRKKKDKKYPTIRYKAAVIQHLAIQEHQRGFLTVCTQFRNAMAELMQKVLSCEVHFVRCIKPNNYQVPERFDPDTVLVQARSSAVVETARARNVGFSVWFTFTVFIHRFSILVGLPPNAAIKDASQTCQKMLRKLADPRGWKVGKNKVFLTYWCMERLKTLVDRVSSCAVVIQKGFRGWRARKLYKRIRSLTVLQNKATSNFLATIGNQSEQMFQHISNQVMEEDVRESRKRNELTTSQREPWNPVMLGQRSPASTLTRSGRDEPDAAGPSDESLQTSPRPTSPQQRISDLSISSLTDVFGPDSPTRPGPPQTRSSKISVTSMSSTFSIESEDSDAPASQVWCRVSCFERENLRAEFSIDRPTIIIDGSKNSFDVTRIGLGALPPSSDSKVTKVRDCIGKGIRVNNDEDWNVWVTRGSKNPVFVKGSFLSEEVISKKGKLEHDKAAKVFNWEAFVEDVRYYCQPQIFHPDVKPEIISSASIFISFVKDAVRDVDTPCWVQLDVLAAVEQAKAACKFARERRLEEKKQKLNSMPPILRPRPGIKSREIMAVSNMEQKVRPKRYIETVKFERKAWARKEVAVNPFLYGKKDDLSAVSNRRSGESNPGVASPVPQSLAAAFGSGLDLEDGATTLSYNDVLQQSPGSQQQSDTVGASSSAFAGVPEKPKKKVWARKKSEDTKR